MNQPFPTDPDQIRALFEPLFQKYERIRRVYLFGSVAEGTSGPASDLDVAVLCARGEDRTTYINFGYDLYARLSALLASDRLDVIVLNAVDSLELRYAVVQDGVILFDRGDDLDAFERNIRHEYQDHMMTLKRLEIL